MTAAERDRLTAYMNDHLAGSIVARELAERRRKEPMDPAIEDFLDGFVAEVDQDRAALRRAMEAAGVESQIWRELAAKGAAWLDGLRPRTSSSSPQLVRDIEVLLMGVQGKLLLWVALADLPDPPLPRPELRRLQQRAEDQYGRLRALHERSVEIELSPIGTASP